MRCRSDAYFRRYGREHTDRQTQRRSSHYSASLSGSQYRLCLQCTSNLIDQSLAHSLNGKFQNTVDFLVSRLTRVTRWTRQKNLTQKEWIAGFLSSRLEFHLDRRSTQVGYMGMSPQNLLGNFRNIFASAITPQNWSVLSHVKIIVNHYRHTTSADYSTKFNTPHYWKDRQLMQ